jgi:uncharacterized coiled-coil DUF342 family protein
MQARKIKFEISRGSLRYISGSLLLVENELDEQYNLIKTEIIEELMPVKFNYDWINKEAAELFVEVDAWKKKALELCKQFEGKQLKSNEIAVVWNPRYETQLVDAFKQLQTELNKIKNNNLI